MPHGSEAVGSMLSRAMKSLKKNLKNSEGITVQARHSTKYHDRSRSIGTIKGKEKRIMLKYDGVSQLTEIGYGLNFDFIPALVNNAYRRLITITLKRLVLLLKIKVIVLTWLLYWFCQLLNLDRISFNVPLMTTITFAISILLFRRLSNDKRSAVKRELPMIDYIGNPEREPILYLDGVSVTFDGFKALNGLSFYVDPGEIRAIIGPNGAGKTTMMDIITGKTRPDRGQV